MIEVPLGEALELVIDHRGKTPKKLGGDFTESGIPVVSAIHIKDGIIQWSERERYVSPQMFAKWMPERLQKGDVLLTSEAPLGQTALVPSGDDLVLSQRLFALRGKEGMLDSAYLRYFLASDVGQRRLHNRATGTTVIGIRQSELMKVLVPLPPLDDQRHIAGILGSLDDLIEMNGQLMQQILSLSRALWSAAVYPNTRRVRLATIAEVNPSRAKRTDDSDVIYLAIADVKDGSIAWPSPTTWSVAPAAARLLAQKGDVIWSRVRPNRRSHALLPATNSRIVVSTGMVVLRPKGVSPAYLMAACDNVGFADRLTAIAGGTAYPTVDADDFSGVEVPLMSENQRRKFDETMTPMWEAFGALEEENRELSQIRDELLPLLMSGRVRPGDISA